MSFFLEILSLIFFTYTWLKTRPKLNSAEVNLMDVFSVGLLLVVVPYSLIDPMGKTLFGKLESFAVASIDAQIILAITFIVGSCVLWINSWMRATKTTCLVDLPPAIELKISWFAVWCSIFLLFVLLLQDEFLNFRLVTFKFLIGKLTDVEYSILRNKTLTGTWLLDEVLGRIRFAILPVLFCLIITPLLRAGRIVMAGVLAILFFLTIPLSLAKLPFFYYAGYLVVAWVLVSSHKFSLKKLISLWVVVSIVGFCALVFLYVIQEGWTLKGLSGLVRPAIQRIWGEPYAAILKYCLTYPDLLSFTGVNGVGVFAKILGLKHRIPDLEVLQALYGINNYGSNPGYFVLGGYAAWGLIGVAGFSFLGFMYVCLLDRVFDVLRVILIRQIFKAVLMLNVLFLLQVSLQTTLITYGLFVIPCILFFLDQYFSRLINNSKK
jgi:hypothetical protein